MEDLEYVTLPQDKIVILKVLLYSPPNILIMCNVNTDLYKYVMTTLTDEISDYCNSTPEQTYNPRTRELCCVNVSTGKYILYIFSNIYIFVPLQIYSTSINCVKLLYSFHLCLFSFCL